LLIAAYMGLLEAADMASLLGWLSYLFVAFLSRKSMFLASLTSWGPYCSLGFTLTASHITVSEDDYRDFNPATQYLAFNTFL
jgi:hypothetical protein